jgi:hypothetical protein
MRIKTVIIAAALAVGALAAISITMIAPAEARRLHGGFAEHKPNAGRHVRPYHCSVGHRVRLSGDCSQA